MSAVSDWRGLGLAPWAQLAEAVAAGDSLKAAALAQKMGASRALTDTLRNRVCRACGERHPDSLLRCPEVPSIQIEDAA